MRNLISCVVAMLALAGCGQDITGTKQEKGASEVAAPAGTPKMVLIRVPGKVTGMDAAKTGEARVVDAEKTDLSASADAMEKLFDGGQSITIAASVQQDDSAEASTESWWGFGWGGWGGGWGGYGLGFGWPYYSYYRPYSYYNPYFYGYGYGYGYYNPYFYGGYSYYPFCW